MVLGLGRFNFRIPRNGILSVCFLWFFAGPGASFWDVFRVSGFGLNVFPTEGLSCNARS